VQAPHSAIPQPNLVPVSPITSRSTHSNGISSGTSTVWSLPLTRSVTMTMPSGDLARVIQDGASRPRSRDPMASLGIRFLIRFA
jgi:hypothetical protein